MLFGVFAGTLCPKQETFGASLVRKKKKNAAAGWAARGADLWAPWWARRTKQEKQRLDGPHTARDHRGPELVPRRRKWRGGQMGGARPGVGSRRMRRPSAGFCRAAVHLCGSAKRIVSTQIGNVWGLSTKESAPAGWASCDTDLWTGLGPRQICGWLCHVGWP